MTISACLLASRAQRQETVRPNAKFIVPFNRSKLTGNL